MVAAFIGKLNVTETCIPPLAMPAVLVDAEGLPLVGSDAVITGMVGPVVLVQLELPVGGVPGGAGGVPGGVPLPVPTGLTPPEPRIWSRPPPPPQLVNIAIKISAEITLREFRIAVIPVISRLLRRAQIQMQSELVAKRHFNAPLGTRGISPLGPKVSSEPVDSSVR